MSAPAHVELERADCPLGCPPDDEPVLVGRDRLQNLPGEFPIVRCRRCGVLRTDPRPTPGSIGFYYPDEYGPYEGTRVPVSSHLPSRPRWRRAISDVVQRLTDSKAEALPDLPPGRMLEVGCASGSYLDRMARRGWQVEGIEFSDAAAAQARSLGIPGSHGPRRDRSAAREQYDLVVGWMVLEHLHDPVGALRRLREWTKPGGWLVVSVPNADAWELPAFGNAWYALHLPNHLWHPGRRSIERVLDRAGWKLSRVVYQRDIRNIVGSIGYCLRDRGRFPRLAAWMSKFPERGGRIYYALHPIAFVLAGLREAGRITVWARRDD